MPFITAREDAGLSRSPNSRDIDALVREGQTLAVDWVQSQDNGAGLVQIRLAGNYTCPESHNVLAVGDLRFANSTRFDIPATAWIRIPLTSSVVSNVSVSSGTTTQPSRQPHRVEAVAALISAAQCEAIFGRAVSPEQLADLNSCLQRFEITTFERIAHFLAQIGHESGGLQYMKEIASGRNYEGRPDLGNTEPGDGPRFKGAGVIRLTGRYNYQEFSEFIGDPRVMEGCDYVASKYPFTSAGFWWRINAINRQVDSGASCRQISARVNGRDPANGLDDRERYFRKAVAVLRSEEPSLSAATGEVRTAASESVRTEFDPSEPIDWQNPRCKVSRYFTVAEVTQGKSNRIPARGSQEEANILRLAKELDKVREAWGSPIGVTSWYRPAAVNKAVGGVADSQHLYGLAADIYTMDATDQWHPRNQEFERWLDQTAWCDRALGFGCAANKGFTHVDLRGRLRWNY
jgi:putative chitinase